jgi:hypothetical protein
VCFKDGEILSARQQIRMLDNRMRVQSRQSQPPPQTSDPTDDWYREPSATPSVSEHMEGEESASRKRAHKGKIQCKICDSNICTNGVLQ